MRLRGDLMGEGKIVHSLCICSSGFTYKHWRLLVAVKNGPLHTSEVITSKLWWEFEPSDIKHSHLHPSWTQLIPVHIAPDRYCTDYVTDHFWGCTDCEIQGRYRCLFKNTIWLIPIQMIFLSFSYLVFGWNVLILLCQEPNKMFDVNK